MNEEFFYGREKKAKRSHILQGIMIFANDCYLLFLLFPFVLFGIAKNPHG